MNLQSINTPQFELPAIAIIIILHLVVLVGIGIYNNANIVNYTWINLSITFLLGVIFFINNSKIIIAFLLAFSIGILSEGIGVNTGILFGDYHYSSILGYHIWNVPITIGLLWFLLSIATKNVADRHIENKYLVAIFASLLMVAFDMIMEPVAVSLDFWQWHSDTIPFQNYLSWFLVSFIIQICWINIETKNRVIDITFLVQTLFFIGLNILL